jgi:acetylornithine deacetylase
VAAESPVVGALAAALEECGEPVRVSGMSAWTDAALLNAAGIPAICFGPGDISLAHAAEEYIPLDEIDRATAVLAALARRWCG